MPALTTILAASLSFLSQDPAARAMQIVLMAAGGLAVFFVFYTMRDSLLRSRSFLFQIFSIFLVACLPVAGFLIYLLIRPSRTIRERELERMVLQLLDETGKTDHEKKPQKKEHKKETKTHAATPPIIATMTVTQPVETPLASVPVA